MKWSDNIYQPPLASSSLSKNELLIIFDNVHFMTGM